MSDLGFTNLVSHDELVEDAKAWLARCQKAEAQVASLERRLEEAREALRAIWTYIKADEPERHRRMGEACGVDACVLCLAETTAAEVLARLQGSVSEGDGR